MFIFMSYLLVFTFSRVVKLLRSLSLCIFRSIADVRTAFFGELEAKESV